MSPRSAIDSLRAALPGEGMFADKEWRWSPQAFPLEPRIVGMIQALGPALRAFQRACNELYFAGGKRAWIARLMDQGKPREVIELGREQRWREALPAVLRPDLVLTEAGLCMSELDSLPGGIGLTAWLNESYAALGQRVIGGADGMVSGFAAAFPSECVLISQESAGYAPEMRWLMAKLGRRVWETWRDAPGSVGAGPLYRFFELWDLANVEHASDWLARARAGENEFTPPLKAFLEEKMWLALFWVPELAGYWEGVLPGEHLELLRAVIPMGWVVDPQVLPPDAVWHGIGVHRWGELAGWGRRERELVLKISGYSERGWGSRGVFMGHDLSREAWGLALGEALRSFPMNPFVLQRFHAGRVLEHPMWEERSGVLLAARSRVRLCPYYFVPQGADTPQLGGVLATVCPADKKILHGMKDAMMLPCTVAGG
jgi:hypothetical protein